MCSMLGGGSPAACNCTTSGTFTPMSLPPVTGRDVVALDPREGFRLLHAVAVVGRPPHLAPQHVLSGGRPVQFAQPPALRFVQRVEQGRHAFSPPAKYCDCGCGNYTAVAP